MQPRLRQLLDAFFSPLQLAGYLAWFTVWLSNWQAFGRYPEWSIWLHASMLLFLVLFAGETALRERFGRAGFALSVTAMALIGLLTAALAPFGASPILLVLVGAVLATGLDGARLATALGLLCLAFAVLVLTVWPGPLTGRSISFLAYCSFVGFAALVTRMAVRAEALAERLTEANSELIATRSLLAEGARESERLSLSRELHDVAGHTLTALKLNLAALARDARQPEPDRVALCARLADELLQNLRAVVRQQRRHEGLAIAESLARLAEPFPRPRLRLDVEPGLRIAGLERAEAVLRLVQEGLTNAARHSSARWLDVALHREGDLLCLRLEDDGRLAALPRPGNGVKGMRERLEALDGSLQIDRGPGGGLRLIARLPAGER